MITRLFFCSFLWLTSAHTVLFFFFFLLLLLILLFFGMKVRNSTLSARLDTLLQQQETLRRQLEGKLPVAPSSMMTSPNMTGSAAAPSVMSAASVMATPGVMASAAVPQSSHLPATMLLPVSANAAASPSKLCAVTPVVSAVPASAMTAAPPISIAPAISSAPAAAAAAAAAAASAVVVASAASDTNGTNGSADKRRGHATRIMPAGATAGDVGMAQKEHFEANNRRLAVLSRRLEDPKTFAKAIAELTSWCRSHQAFHPALRNCLYACLFVACRCIGRADFDVALCKGLFRTCSRHLTRMDPELKSLVENALQVKKQKKK